MRQEPQPERAVELCNGVVPGCYLVVSDLCGRVRQLEELSNAKRGDSYPEAQASTTFR